MKTVVCVWTTHYHLSHRPSIEIGLGLGDMIRGAVGLFEYCREKKHHFYLDIQLHPISNILDIDHSPFADIVNANASNIKFYQDPINVIEQSENNLLLIATNFCPYKVFSDEAKQFMMKLLTPKNWVASIFEAQLENNKLNRYNIMHIRCGDNEFLNKRNSWKRFVAMQMIKYNYEKGDLILTDSVKLKSHLKTNDNFKIFTDTSVHLAHDFDSTTLLDTMLEFYAIARSCKIKTYSRYSHTSGFVYFPSVFYGIPLETMKMPWHIRMLDIAINLLELYSFRFLKIFNRNTVAPYA